MVMHEWTDGWDLDYMRTLLAEGEECTNQDLTVFVTMGRDFEHKYVLEMFTPMERGYVESHG